MKSSNPEIYALQAIQVQQRYGSVHALKGVNLDIKKGEVHALIGKNGAGKSSLIKIFSGATVPTAGELRIDGQPVRFDSPSDAIRKGIATVYQELSLVPTLSIAENILLGRLPRRADGIRIDWAATRAAARRVLAEFGLDLDVNDLVSSHSVAQQQMIEIARAMSWKPRVLMLDEPTSALTGEETEKLFGLIRLLKQSGVAVIYISHRLQELKQIADVITVLRDGELIGSMPGADARAEAIAAMMFGEAVPNHRPADLTFQPEVVLEVRELERAPRVNGVSFQLRRGEILGLAGMLGSGRTELMRMLAGADRATRGTIHLAGEPITDPSPARMKQLGIGMTPENRKEEGFIPQMNIAQNLCLAPLDRITQWGMIRGERQKALVRESVRELQIKVADTGLLVSTLSGGNQQKVVVGNWLNTQPKIMLYDEPTRGIDVQAKQQIFQIIWKLSREGLSSIFVSSELEEMLEVCHRLLIMIEGRIVGEVMTDGLSLEQLLKLCTGETKV